MIDFYKLREDFIILNKIFENNQKLIYFDNAATSLKPKQVIEAINNYYINYPVNIHRGNYKLSQQASVIYEDTHNKVAKFINCKNNEVIFTSNSTDSINCVMYSLYNSNYFKKGDEIIISLAEHHANLVPWQYLAKKLKLVLKFINIKEDFTLDIDDFKDKITTKTKLVCINHITNTTGTINPIKDICKIAHNHGSLILVDGSQSVPHLKIDFKELNVDFLVFTAHKMLGPTGIGCLISKEKILLELEPFKFGGDMISNVTKNKSNWNKLPLKFEAGTPNIAGAFGLNAAIDYLNNIGLDNIYNQDKKLLKYTLEKLEPIENLNIYNIKDYNKQAPILLLDLKGIDCRTFSTILDEQDNIATRAGVHCAQPIINKYTKTGFTRVSLYFYNTFEEINILEKSILKIDKLLNK
jgi:cysteine desulfurase / selenocysteine lyase